MNVRHYRVSTLALLTGAVVAASMLGGCKNKESQIVGKWTDDKGTAVEFKENKTFVQGSGSNVVAGKWSFAEPNVTVSIETIGGKSVDETLKSLVELQKKFNPTGKAPDLTAIKKQMSSITLSLSEDGKKLSMKPPAGSNMQPVTLSKQGA